MDNLEVVIDNNAYRSKQLKYYYHNKEKFRMYREANRDKIREREKFYKREYRKRLKGLAVSVESVSSTA